MRSILVLLFFFKFCCVFSQGNNPSIGFIENKGQIVNQQGKPNPSVKYLLNTNGLNVQLRSNGFSYDIYEIKKHPLNKKAKNNLPTNLPQNDLPATLDYKVEYKYHRIDVEFENSNSSVKLIAEQQSSDFENYYNVKHAPNGITNVYKFQKVTYKSLYNNIDVVFFIPEDLSKPVEYNFIIHPGGNSEDIQLQFSGAKTDLVDNKIRMNLRFGQMEETLPLSWIANGKLIDVGYTKIKKNLYGFKIPQKKFSETLVIDPVPIRLWGTYYGGSGNELAGSINIDTFNNVIISGYTGSGNNIATAGPNTSGYYSGGAYIAKFLPEGQRIWSSFYPFATFNLKLDSQNNMYVFGNSLEDNSDIPSPGCFQPIKDIYNSGYLVKLNALGAKVWGTWYGGNDNDYVEGATIDSDFNVYIVGPTSSTDAFATPGAFQTTKQSPGYYQTGYIAKFDSDGNRIWGTFYGGSLADGFYDCSISSDGNLIAIGTHNSSNLITTPGSFQPTSSVGGGMIIKFDLNGNRIWGTFIADNSYLFRGNLKGDNVILSGRAFPGSALGTPGSMYENYITNLPAGSMLSMDNNFLIKFNIQTQQCIWGTYVNEQIINLDVDSSDNIFIGGETGINSGLTTPDAYMPTKDLYHKSYLIKLDPSGHKIWGTYYGGNAAEQWGTPKVDLNNDIYLYGMTNGSTTGIATAGASQMTNGSNPDTYLVKFRDCMSSATVASNSPICIGNTLNLTSNGGTNYLWTGPNGFTSNLQNPIILNASAAHSGQYSVTITGTSSCDGSNTVDVLVGDMTKPLPNIAALPTITGDCDTTIPIPTATDNCAGTVTATTTDSLSYNLPGTYTIHWSYNDGNQNIQIQEQTVTIADVLLPTTISMQTFCVQQNPTLASIVITAQNLKWYDAPTGGNLLPLGTALQDGFSYYASQTINGCESLTTAVFITIPITPTPTGPSVQNFCSTQNALLSDVAITGTDIIWYNSASGGTPLPVTTVLVDNTTYYAAQTISGCESVNRLSITITLLNTLNASDYSTTLCDSADDDSENINLADYTGELIALPATFNFQYYVTTLGAANQTVSDLIPSVGNYKLTTGTNIIYVRITSAAGCFQVVRLNLTLVANPVIAIPDMVRFCEGSFIAVNAGVGFSSYSWSNGAVSPSINISEAGDYSVTVTQNYGTTVCSTNQSFTAAMSNKATVNSISTEDMTINGNTIIVNASGLGNYEYSIDGTYYQTSNIFRDLAAGEYTIYVRDINKCGIVLSDAYVLMYPTLFTPNGDGYNDTWKVKLSELEPDLSVEIFDRYGKLLQSLGAFGAWDGKYNSADLPSTDYWFVVTRANGAQYRGHFTLKR